MDKLMDYVCEELEELEHKAEKNGKLSMSEIEYVDKLAHIKKSLLAAEEMSDGYSGRAYDNTPTYTGGSYAMGGRYSRGNRNSYARGRGANARRDSMGRYSREGGYSMDNHEMIEELRELMEEAPTEQARKEFQRFISKMEMM